MRERLDVHAIEVAVGEQSSHTSEQLRLCRPRRGVRCEPRDGDHRQPVGRLPVGHPDFDRSRVVEPGACDADDLVALPAVGLDQSPADDARVTAEVFAPGAIAEDELELGPGLLVAGLDQATQQRSCAEDLEEVARDRGAVEHERPIAVEHRRRRCAPVREGRDAAHGRAGGLDLLQVVAEEEVVRVRIAAIRVELDDPILIRNRQRADDDGVEHGEHRDRHPDADREDGDGGDGERGRAAEAAQGDADVVPNALHSGS